MKAVDFLKRLESKEFFKEFMKENPDSYLCAVFCILTKDETEGDKINLDFFLPSKNKIAYSESPFQEVLFSEQESKGIEKLQNLDKIKVDLEDLWEEVERAKKEKNIQSNTGKIIGVLTAAGWNLTCIGASLDVVRIKIDAYSKEILEAKKSNLGDIVKIDKKKD